MKTKMLLALLIAATNLAWSQPDLTCHQFKWQHRHGNTGDEVRRLDSMMVFNADRISGTDVPGHVFVYYYDRKSDDFNEVVKFLLPERTNSNRQLYTYASDGFRTSYLYQEWEGNSWQNKKLTNYFQNDAGDLGRELFSRPDASGQWVEYQQHFYEYDLKGRIALYLRQMRNPDGPWYDFSENIWTFNDNDQLVHRMEKRTADDYIIWTETFDYGDGTRPVERIRQTMRYDPVVRHNVLTNDTRNLYYYDEFNDPKVVELYNWENNDWVYAGRNIYYYSFIPGRKATICHNGHTILVAPQAVPAHLAHGDHLGACTGDEEKTEGMESPFQREKTWPVTVFPNPADTQFEVKLEPGHPYRSAVLISGDGRVISSKKVADLEQVSFNISALKSGNYLLKLSGQRCPDKVMVIMK